MRDNEKDNGMTLIENPLKNPRFMAATTRAHLRMIALGGQPPRGVRKGDVLGMAGRYTGKVYGRTAYKEAIADLTAFLESLDKGE